MLQHAFVTFLFVEIINIMAAKTIALEFKNRRLTRPMLDQIVGAQSRVRPKPTELIVRCKSATKTAYEAVDSNSYDIKVTIVPNQL